MCGRTHKGGANPGQDDESMLGTSGRSSLGAIIEATHDRSGHTPDLRHVISQCCRESLYAPRILARGDRSTSTPWKSSGREPRLVRLHLVAMIDQRRRLRCRSHRPVPLPGLVVVLSNMRTGAALHSVLEDVTRQREDYWSIIRVSDDVFVRPGGGAGLANVQRVKSTNTRVCRGTEPSTPRWRG
jgi:hypothetical protein